MSDHASPYSITKLAHHPAALAKLRAGGRPAVPVQIHLMPQNRCNHDCGFCVAEGTEVDTIRGRIKIEDVRIGDVVCVGDAGFDVIDTMQRSVDREVEIETEDGDRLRCSVDHPIFTARGFVVADAVRPGDRVGAALRLRLREADQALRPRVEVEVGEVPAIPSATPGSERDGSCGGCEADARAEPDEEPGVGREDASDHPRTLPRRDPEVSGGCRQNQGRCEEADAVVNEPDEGSGDSEARPLALPSSFGEEQDRGVVRVDCGGCETSDPVHRERVLLDRAPEPRLRGDRAEGRDRGHAGHGFQLGRGDSEDARRVRHEDDRALPGTRVALSRRLPSVPSGEGAAWSCRDGSVFLGERRISGVAMRRVVSVRRIDGRARVFNLTCLVGEAFIANGILTHNCSYRLSGWKNSEQFDDREEIPWPILQTTLRDAAELGTKAVELTGGGEPLLYSHIDRLLELIHELRLDLGLVTNGTALTAARAAVIGAMPDWKWARVSIDAGTPDTYCAVRGVGSTHWDRAWNAVRLLAAERDAAPQYGERRVGVGFVVTRENFAEVHEACRLAKDAGADNVRISIRFGPDGNDYYGPGMLDEAEQQGDRAKAELSCDGFRVNHLVAERRGNQLAGRQDYEPCHTMRLLCVIGGDAKVYSCCTLAFSPAGEMGDLRQTTFRDLWTGPAGDEWFRRFKVAERCAVTCLYEGRNRAMIGMVGAETPPPVPPDGIHVNFI